jgi:hypothetical protein
VSEPSAADGQHAQAQRALLEGLRRGEDLTEIERVVRATQTRGFTADLAVPDVGVAAMDLADVDRRTPIAKSELVTNHLPELNFRNQRRLQERTTYALNAVAAIRSGLQPDILDDTYWWQTRDIVQYASSPRHPMSAPAHNAASKHLIASSTIYRCSSTAKLSSQLGRVRENRSPTIVVVAGVILANMRT